MKIRKKLLAAIVAAVFILTACPVSAHTPEKKLTYSYYYVPAYGSSNVSQKVSAEALTSVEGFEEYFVSEVKDYKAEIMIYDYQIPKAKFGDVLRLFWNNHPELFQLRSGGELSYSCLGDFLYSITPTYDTVNVPRAEYGKMLEECEKAAAKLLDGITDNGTLTDEMKALLLHDRLATWCEYGYTANQHNMYSALANGVSVCQGYAMAYMFLLNKAGIENYYCSSEALNHGWNVVYINNKPYHVDVTSDDPTPNAEGYVRHKYFLISTSTARSNYAEDMENTAYDFDTSPTDRYYEDFYWNGVETSFCLAGNKVCYLGYNYNNEGVPIEIALFDASSHTEVYSLNIDSEWMVGATDYYIPWDGSKLASDGINFYFNTNNRVYKYNPKTREAAVIYNSNNPNNEAVYCFSLKDNKFTIEKYRAFLKEENENKDVLLTALPQEVITLGDVNGDEKTTIQDFIGLKKKLSSGQNVFINGIGQIKAFDLVWLQRFLLTH